MRRQNWLETSSEIWGSHDIDVIDYSLTECDAVYCGTMLPTASTTRRDLQWKLVFLAVAAFNIKK
jgi:hypothetical protein